MLCSVGVGWATATSSPRSLVKGVGTPREAPKNVFWNVSVFSSDSGGEMIAFASSMH